MRHNAKRNETICFQNGTLVTRNETEKYGHRYEVFGYMYLTTDYRAYVCMYVCIYIGSRDMYLIYGSIWSIGSIGIIGIIRKEGL